MRRLELSTLRDRLVLPNVEEASATFHYYLKNREHLRPTEPRIPEQFFGRVSILVETFLLKIPRAIFFTMPLPDKNQVLAAVA